jgi:hypothetical protein
MSGFFKLIEQYSTQDEPAFCGLSSLTMVLNALAIDPRRPWKGAWRWFHEAMLDCCLPLDYVQREGIVLSQVSAGPCGPTYEQVGGARGAPRSRLLAADARGSRAAAAAGRAPERRR